MEDEIALEKELGELRKAHKELDEKIDTIPSVRSFSDQARLKALKKERLALRDRIVQLEMILYPDIIA